MKIKVIENFITKEDAEALIGEIVSPSEVNPYPDFYKTRWNGGENAYPYNKKVIALHKKYGKIATKVAEDFFDVGKQVIVTKCFGSGWNPGGYGAPHIDSNDIEPHIEYSAAIYLNDDFEGGAINFPRQNFRYQPKKYSAVFFPGNDREYEHEVETLLSGRRFTLLYMMGTYLPAADPDLL